MKLDNQKIRDMFAMFTDLPDSELSDWTGLCDSAALQIADRLRENVDVQRHMERLCVAAAATAYCDYTVLTSGAARSSGEIRVGEISLKNTDSQNAGLDAIETRDHFLAEIADLIKAPTGFAVRSAGNLP